LFELDLPLLSTCKWFKIVRFTILPEVDETCVSSLILLIGDVLCTNKAAAVFAAYERHKRWNLCLAAVNIERCMLHKAFMHNQLCVM